MSHLTPIGSRLSASLSDEYVRIQNEWFFKWHHIGGTGVVEIDSFRGKPICYGGIKFSGSAHLVYWDTIQHYVRKKLISVFNDLEAELKGYPLEIRDKALTEAQGIIAAFAAKIRRAAVEKDRILRGNGIQFPPQHDIGQWLECHPEDIATRIEGLRHIYCDLAKPTSDSETATAHAMPERVAVKLSDVVILKPIIMGMGIDLHKAWCWAQTRLRPRRRL